MASYSVNWSAPIAAVAGTVTAGQCLVPDASGKYVVGTAANRTSFGRCDGLAVTPGDASNPVVMIEAGPIEASFTGLGTGTASWVRVSTAGALERCVPTGSDDVVGWCETTGRLHSVWGTLTAAIVNGAAAFTPPTGTGFATATAGVLDAAALAFPLPVAKGGTGLAALTIPASGLLVGTTDAQTLTNKTIAGASNTLTVRIANDVTGLGANVATMLATFSSANIKTACTDETGSGGALVFATSPTLTTPVINGQIQGAAVAMGASAIDWSLGPVFTKTLSAGANTFTFSNQASGMVITVRVTGAASTLTWPTVKWAGGAAPTQTASGTDVYTFVHDGTSIYGSVVQAMA